MKTFALIVSLWLAVSVVFSMTELRALLRKKKADKDVLLVFIAFILIETGLSLVGITLWVVQW